MTGAEGVVFAFAAFQEARQTGFLTQGFHAGVPSGEELVRIPLVANVPHQLVAGSVEDRVERDRQLDDTESRANMPASARADVDQPLPNLVGERAQFIARQSFQVRR